MSPKDFVFIGSLISFVFFIVLFYLIGKFFIKTKTLKLRLIVIFLIAAINFCLITLKWLFIESSPVLDIISNGLSGNVFGYAISQIKLGRKNTN